MSARNRNCGNQYERDIVNELKELGYNVVTARKESRTMDARKVDVFSPLGVDNPFPYYIQAKFNVNSPSYHNLLNEMPSDRTPIVFHKKGKSIKTKTGKTQIRTVGEFVIMKKSDFYSIIKTKEERKSK